MLQLSWVQTELKCVFVSQIVVSYSVAVNIIMKHMIAGNFMFAFGLRSIVRHFGNCGAIKLFYHIWCRFKNKHAINFHFFSFLVNVTITNIIIIIYVLCMMSLHRVQLYKDPVVLKRRLVKNYCLVTFHSSSSGTRQRCLPSNLYSKMCKVCA